MSNTTPIRKDSRTATPAVARGATVQRILVVDDNEAAALQLQELLRKEGQLEVDTVPDGTRALERLADRSYSLVITDLRMPRLDGMQLVQQIHERQIPATVIVITGQGSIEEAVQAMRQGVYHFLTKPLDVEQLQLVVDRALQERSLQDELIQLREQLQDTFSFQNVLSKSPRMHAVFELIGNLAHTNTTVLIEGETGTGKEQVARAIHLASQGRKGPLVAINCAALPENLLESELFGHEKGAFTNAVSQRRGRFELADGGTIFLDEVGDVPASMQAKLLRVLQERRFERVGGTESIEVDVRVIAATNRSLHRLVRKGTFREDLYYRLNVVKIDLPPLRERIEDIPLLAMHFVEKYTPPGETPFQIAPDAMEALISYAWPGNIRQLENAIERACVTAQEGMIRVANLPGDVIAPPVRKDPFSIDLSRPLPELIRETVARLEEQYIRKALQKTRGNVGRCARLCGLSRRSISAKLGEYGIDKDACKEL